MPRYAIRPRAIVCDEIHPIEDQPFTPPLSVDDQPTRYTGLLDRAGNEIVALPEPIGFIELREGE